MRDLWHDILRFTDHNRGIVLSIFMVAMLGIYLVGCDITTGSLITPGVQVKPQQLRNEIRLKNSEFEFRRAELVNMTVQFNAEAESFEQAVKDRTDDLNQQHELRKQIIYQIGGFAVDAATGTFNPVSAVSTLLSLISFATATGVMIDNARKNRVIQALKTNKER